MKDLIRFMLMATLSALQETFNNWRVSAFVRFIVAGLSKKLN